MKGIRYRHTQIGYLMIAALSAGIVGITLAMILEGFNWLAFAVCVILFFSLCLFSTLTVQLLDDALFIFFGLGFIRKRFPLREIASCRVVKNPWYYGWGIRRTPHGWLYRVSGSRAVEIQMKNGKKFRIGSDEPEELVEAIRNL